MSSRKQWQQQFTGSVVNSKYQCDPLRPTSLPSVSLAFFYCCIPSFNSLSVAFSLLLSFCFFLSNTLQHKVLEPIPLTQEAFVGGCALECKKKIYSEIVKVICFIAESGQACLMTFKTVELESRECKLNVVRPERDTCVALVFNVIRQLT